MARRATEGATPRVEGAVSPPYLSVSFENGQVAIIPVDFACSLQVIDPHGVIRATVHLTGVTGVSLDLGGE